MLTLDIIQSDLENLFGTHVDMVRMREHMNPLLRQRIQREGFMFDRELVVGSLEDILSVCEKIKERTVGITVGMILHCRQMEW